MKERPLIDLGMTGYDELFMNDAERREATLPKIYNIPLSEIDDFPDHPFQVRLDEDMDQLVESVKERGVITPITLRQKADGRYEIVSGHRRRKACELAGLATVPAEIKELTRDEAIILMVESNLQRSTILPSEVFNSREAPGSSSPVVRSSLLNPALVVLFSTESSYSWIRSSFSLSNTTEKVSSQRPYPRGGMSSRTVYSYMIQAP